MLKKFLFMIHCIWWAFLLTPLSGNTRNFKESVLLLHLWGFENIKLLKPEFSQKIIKMAEGEIFCFLLEGHLIELSCMVKMTTQSANEKSNESIPCTVIPETGLCCLAIMTDDLHLPGHAMRSNKQHQDGTFSYVRMVYFPGTLYCWLEGLTYNFASKVVFLLGKTFPLFYFIQSALNNNILQFFPDILIFLMFEGKEKKASFGVPLRITLTSNTMLWIMKMLSVRIGCIYQFKTYSVSKLFACLQGNWKASLKNLLMCFLKLTKLQRQLLKQNIINFYLSKLISARWKSFYNLCFKTREFFSIDYISLSSSSCLCVNWHFLSSRNLITMHRFSIAS